VSRHLCGFSFRGGIALFAEKAGDPGVAKRHFGTGNITLTGEERGARFPAKADKRLRIFSSLRDEGREFVRILLRPGGRGVKLFV
jgi:hypothetical protein